MEQLNDAIAMLDLMTRGAFCVKNGTIEGVNAAAQKHAITVGTPVSDILITGKQEYPAFQEGCLHLTVQVSGTPCGATVFPMNGFDVFLLDEDETQTQLQTMALAAQELRQPLTSIMSVADRLFPLPDADPEMHDQVARINRGLFQMLRIVSNMSDAYRYCQKESAFQQVRDICSIFDEIFRSTAPMVSHAGVQLNYSGLNESICCLVDAEKLERAISNILSNSLKFLPKGGVIDAALTRNGNMLYLTVQDNGPGFPENMRKNMFTHFLRQPGIEDSRFGIGLGLVLIRSAAAAHGGTVLIEHGAQQGTRLTMSIAIRQPANTAVRSSVLSVDYAGERDHRLLELSESLPADLYAE